MVPEHRRQIVLDAARGIGLDLSDEVVATILERQELDDQELSQLVVALSVRSQVHRRPVDPEMVEEALTPVEVLVERERKELGIPEIFYAIWDCDQEEVETLIGQGADLEAVNPQTRSPHTRGMTPLLDALYQRDAGMVRLLLAAGADPVNRGRHPAYPVHLATANLQCLERVLEAGAGPNVLDSEGKTPLMWAALKDRQLPQVEALLAAGADPEIAAPDGSTALTLAEQNGAHRVAARLRLTPRPSNDR